MATEPMDGLTELRQDVKEIRAAILGTPTHAGLVELVRDHERRLLAIEGLGRKTVGTIADRLLQAGIAGLAGWFAAHFPGTRP